MDLAPEVDPDHVERIRRVLNASPGHPDVVAVRRMIRRAHGEAQLALAGEPADLTHSRLAWASTQLFSPADPLQRRPTRVTANGELLSDLPMAAALAVLADWRFARLVLAGALTGIAALIRPQAAVLGVALAATVVLTGVWGRRPKRTRLRAIRRG